MSESFPLSRILVDWSPGINTRIRFPPPNYWYINGSMQSPASEVNSVTEQTTPSNEGPMADDSFSKQSGIVVPSAIDALDNVQKILHDFSMAKTSNAMFDVDDVIFQMDYKTEQAFWFRCRTYFDDFYTLRRNQQLIIPIAMLLFEYFSPSENQDAYDTVTRAIDLISIRRMDKAAQAMGTKLVLGAMHGASMRIDFPTKWWIDHVRGHTLFEQELQDVLSWLREEYRRE